MDKILSSVDGAIGTLTFNQPERHNAISLDMWRAATAVLEQFEQDAAVRVIVLTGAGGKAFVSGADISKFESERATVDAVLEYNTAVDRFGQVLGTSQKPVLLYCRSGSRAARTWALAEAARPGGLDEQAILQAVEQAGLDASDLQADIARRIAARSGAAR